MVLGPKTKGNKMKYVGECAWCGTIDEFLELTKMSFLRMMDAGSARVTDFVPSQSQRFAWYGEFVKLWQVLKSLKDEYRKLHLLPLFKLQHQHLILRENNHIWTLRIQHLTRCLIWPARQNIFKDDPYEGFAKETRGYLRLLEYWHPRVPRMSAKGALVLTMSTNYGKKYPRVKAISPDRISSIIRKTFADALEPCSDPHGWLGAIRQSRI